MGSFRLHRVLTGIALALALGACARPPAAPSGSAAAVQQADPYVQTSWVLQRWARADGGLEQVPSGAEAITLAFSREQGQPRAAGFAGCNRYSATYVAPQGRLIFSAPVSTRRACLDPAYGQLEQRYLSALTRIVSSTVDDSANPRQLTLGVDNGEVLIFARQADVMTGAPGNVRTIYVDGQRQPCSSSSASRTLCYRVRDSADQPWQLWHGEIEGFNFRPGLSSRLRVVEVPVIAPAPDAPNVRWVLDAVLEQRVEPRGR